MAAVHEEYERYLQSLTAAGATEDVRRIAKIVHANLDTIIPTVHNGRQRTTALTRLLKRGLEATSDVIGPIAQDAATVQLPWTRLKKLSVGAFRGFRRESIVISAFNSGKTTRQGLEGQNL